MIQRGCFRDWCRVGLSCGGRRRTYGVVIRLARARYILGALMIRLPNRSVDWLFGNDTLLKELHLWRA